MEWTLRGYFALSLLDNLEWTQGCRLKFGLVHVNRIRFLIPHLPGLDDSRRDWAVQMEKIIVLRKQVGGR